ncbi:MAG: chlorite dismutase family protein, partial [Candidatus Dormibacteria bacterium]
MTSTTAPASVRDAAMPTPTARQFVRFSFLRVAPAWRARPVEERARDRTEVVELIQDAAAREGVVLRTYSLVGTRGDADLMIWQVSDDLAHFHELSAALNRTRMAPFLETPHHYLAMTKRSTYVERHEHAGQEGRSNRLVISPTGRRYLFVYPFVKTRAWYRLGKEERQRQMSEHIAMGHRFPSVKINTTYSFGLDDQEFVVAFE